MEKEAFIKAVAEMLSNEEKAENSCYRIGESEFDYQLFKTFPIRRDEDLDTRRTLTTDKFLKALVKKFSKCQLKNLLDGRCFFNRTLSCCNGVEQLTCDPANPYRSYDGSCNNLEHPSWGKRGTALKHPFAPCYADLVSKPARSRSGAPLPQNRKLISELSEFLEQYGPNTSSSISMFLVFFFELTSLDMIGRANKRTQCATEGFRGCRADGLDRSAFVSPLTNPLRVLPDDLYYGRSGVSCLNFSPQEKANDRCELKHVGERNLESSYLDLSCLYGETPSFDTQGKLPLTQCGSTDVLVQKTPTTAQLVALSGLFAKLHNYCVDRIRSCPQSKEPVQERCRAFTIGVYQKLVYDQLLPVLFGDELYNMCGLNCEYNPYGEAVVSQVYKSGTGRFAHVWIPEQMLYKPQGRSEWLPFNVFFRNQETFDCSGVLAGSLETPINTNRLSDAIVNKFYTVDGERGTCLPCIDLARNRGAGLCPLVTYKHFVEQLVGEESSCYENFEDLSDMFEPKLLEFLASFYETPGDLDVLLANFERRAYPGANMPKLVSQSTCLQFKRLKCSDRFFYSWNPNLGEGARHLIEIFDFTALLALFTDFEDVPLEPFVVDGPKVPASEVRSYMDSVNYLFCQI
ncbi:chorion peroxidase-like [Anopheles nili]|uniref:chorion peroxidase-like n=1 Tax=Anopheles nili TaxID=185578 RepID=UPI00237C18CA|nr:chorion peroxidase-like [Anopheles nili]